MLIVIQCSAASLVNYAVGIVFPKRKHAGNVVVEVLPNQSLAAEGMENSRA